METMHQVTGIHKYTAKLRSATAGTGDGSVLGQQHRAPSSCTHALVLHNVQIDGFEMVGSVKCMHASVAVRTKASLWSSEEERNFSLGLHEPVLKPCPGMPLALV